MGFEALLARWGLIAVFLGCFFEGETAAVIGGVIAHRGLLHWAETAAVAALGALTADQFWFLLARYMPERGWIGARIAALRRRAKASWLHRRLEANGDLAAMSFRYIPGTRILGPVMLAQTAMPWRRFALLNGLSTLIWASAFTGIGYHFGWAAEAMLGHLHPKHLPVLIIGIVAGFGLLHLALRLWRRSSARS